MFGMLRNVLMVCLITLVVVTVFVVGLGSLFAYIDQDRNHQRDMEKLRAIFGLESNSTTNTPEVELEIQGLIPEAPSVISDADAFNQFLVAVQEKESGGVANPDLAVGAAGEIGRYQIMPAYWTDGVEQLERMGVELPADLTYETGAKNSLYAEAVMFGYFARYEPAALATGDWETLARLHNGGPRWRDYQQTVAYARDVMRNMRDN